MNISAFLIGITTSFFTIFVGSRSHLYFHAPSAPALYSVCAPLCVTVIAPFAPAVIVTLSMTTSDCSDTGTLSRYNVRFREMTIVVPAPGVEPSAETKKAILDYASKRIAKYAMPKDIEFRAELPKTMVGKVAYRVLEEEEAAKQTKED